MLVVARARNRGFGRCFRSLREGATRRSQGDLGYIPTRSVGQRGYLSPRSSRRRSSGHRGRREPPENIRCVRASRSSPPFSLGSTHCDREVARLARCRPRARRDAARPARRSMFSPFHPRTRARRMRARALSTALATLLPSLTVRSRRVCRHRNARAHAVSDRPRTSLERDAVGCYPLQYRMASPVVGCRALRACFADAARGPRSQLLGLPYTDRGSRAARNRCRPDIRGAEGARRVQIAPRAAKPRDRAPRDRGRCVWRSYTSRPPRRENVSGTDRLRCRRRRDHLNLPTAFRRHLVDRNGNRSTRSADHRPRIAGSRIAPSRTRFVHGVPRAASSKPDQLRDATLERVWSTSETSLIRRRWCEPVVHQDRARFTVHLPRSMRSPVNRRERYR